MSQSLWRLPQPARLIALPLVRGKLRGKPPGVARTLEERLAKMAPSSGVPVNIGFRHQPPQERAQLTRLARQNQSNRELERAARSRTLHIPLDQVEEEWSRSHRPDHVQRLAEHYGVFGDLFGQGAFFAPVLPLHVEFPVGAESDACSVVFAGNDIKPAEAKQRPGVTYEADESTLWTLLCVNAEGSVESAAPQTVQWLVQNIPGSEVEAGEELFPYLQPLPYRGTGHHRLVFVLFKQEGKLAPADTAAQPETPDLSGRGFNTEEFYRQHEDQLTPAGLCFFQSDWDSSVTEFYHQTLQRAEPVFEYDEPLPYIRRQRWFPKGESVVHYFDKYADPRDMQKQMLLKRLAMVHPFEGVNKGPKYPLAIRRKPEDRPPTWIINEERKEFRRISKYYYIDRHPETLFDPKR